MPGPKVSTARELIKKLIGGRSVNRFCLSESPGCVPMHQLSMNASLTWLPSWAVPTGSSFLRWLPRVAEEEVITARR